MYEGSLCHGDFWFLWPTTWCFGDQLTFHFYKVKHFAFSWRSGPEIGDPVNLCWTNQMYKAWSNYSSSASFSNFRFNPLHVSMLSVNFRILSLFLCILEICCLLMPNSSPKFVPFPPLSKREIIIGLSFIERTNCFWFEDMLLFWVRIVLCVSNPRSWNWSSIDIPLATKQFWTSQNSAEHIRMCCKVLF